MEEKLKELLEIQEYFNNICSTREGYLDNNDKVGPISLFVKYIFTSTLVTRINNITIENLTGALTTMLAVPAAYGGIDNINKFVRAKEIALEWITYRDDLLNNASTKAYVTVALDNTSNVVITLTDPYADL